MPSTLSCLFRYAKAVEAEARENFTTEALAAAIRHDPEPFLFALRGAGIKLPDGPPTVRSQVMIPEGRLDLLLEVSGAVVAVEVKVNAGETGNQLERYLDWAGREDPTGSVVLLSRGSIDAGARVHRMQWQDVWNAVGDGRTTSPYWSDFKTWLEENRMADSSFESVTDEESNAVDAAFRLLKKAVRIVAPVAKHINRVWPDADYPASDADIEQQILERFGDVAWYTVEGRNFRRVGLSLGIEDGHVVAMLCVDPKRHECVRMAMDLARKLPKPWNQEVDDWGIAVARMKLAGTSHAEATRWLISRGGGA